MARTLLLKMEVAALIALSLLIGALILLVAVAISKRKDELSEQLEQKEGYGGKYLCRHNNAHRLVSQLPLYLFKSVQELTLSNLQTI